MPRDPRRERPHRRDSDDGPRDSREPDSVRTPATMRAAQYDEYGDPDVLEVRRVPVPSPDAGETLIRVHACGLNPKDAWVRGGTASLFTRKSFPRGTGFDFAGEVVRVGVGVDAVLPGQRVWGFLDGMQGGAAAEYLVAPVEWLTPTPEEMGWREAAATPLVACTALQGLRDLGHLEAGDRLLIKGASGGVGTAAIQIAKVYGAHVTAIASGSGRGHCLSLGADEFVNYEETDPTTLDTRFDVFLDCVGESPIFGYGRLLGRRGRWVQVAPSVPIYALAPLSPVVSPVLGLPRIGFVAVRPRARDLEEIRRLAEQDQLHMPVSKVFALEEIQEAHMEAGRKHGRGKTVIAISEEAGSEEGGSGEGR